MLAHSIGFSLQQLCMSTGHKQPVDLQNVTGDLLASIFCKEDPARVEEILQDLRKALPLAQSFGACL